MLAQIWLWLLFVIILGGPIPAAVWLTVRHLPDPDQDKLAQTLLSVLTLWCLMQVGLGLAMGSLGLLALKPVLALETTLAVSGSLLFCLFPLPWIKIRQFFAPLGHAPLQPYEKGVLAALGVVSLVLLDRIATQPFISIDTLWFHGPVVARWYQTGSFTQLDPLGNWIIEHPQARGYPYNWHILFVLCLLPWRQDIFAALPVLLAWGMLGLSIYLLGRQGGADRLYALAAAGLVLGMPILLNHVTTLHIDLPMAAIYTVGLYYGVAYYHSRCEWHGFLCLAAAGLMAGTKAPGIIYAAVLTSLMLLPMGLGWLKANADRPRSVGSLAGLGGLIGLGLGAFWYVRNSLVLGNERATTLVTSSLVASESLVGLVSTPSVGAKLQGLWEQAMYLQGTTLTAQFDWLNPAHWVAFGNQALVRFQLPLVVLVGLVLLLPYGWLRDPRGEHRRIAMGYLGLLLITLFLYWNTPFSAGRETDPLIDPLFGFNMRYGFPVLGILGAVAAIAATQLKVSPLGVTITVLTSSFMGLVTSSVVDKARAQVILEQSLVLPGVLLAKLLPRPIQLFAAIGQLITDQGLTVIWLYLGLFLGIGVLVYAELCWPRIGSLLADRLGPWRRRLRIGLGLLLCSLLVTTVTSHWLQTRGEHRFGLYRGIDVAIAENKEPDQRIAYFSSTYSYILYGKYLDQEVIHLPPDTADPSDWLAILRQSRVALVATSAGEPQYENIRTEALNAAIAPQGPLTPIFGQTWGRGIQLYRLQPEYRDQEARVDNNP